MNLIKLQEPIVSCGVPFAQWAAVAALEGSKQVRYMYVSVAFFLSLCVTLFISYFILSFYLSRFHFLALLVDRERDTRNLY